MVDRVVAEIVDQVKGVLFWLRPEERISVLIKLRDLMARLLDEEE
jgi:hypothetical protein